MAASIALFGAFVLMVTVFGFFLWQSLFGSEEYAGREPQSKPAYAEQQSAKEEAAVGGNSAPSAAKAATDEALAEYTKWLAIFTMFLVLATIGLYISGERNVDAARKSAKAAQDAADIARSTLIVSNRPWIRGEAVPADMHFDPNDFGVAVAARLTFRNVGKSPAKRLRAMVKVVDVATLREGELRQIQREMCNDFRTKVVDSTIVVFPDEMSFHQRYVDSIGPEKAKAIKSDKRSYSPYLIACAAYDFEPQIFITSFVVRVDLKDAQRLESRVDGLRHFEPTQFDLYRLSEFDLFD